MTNPVASAAAGGQLETNFQSDIKSRDNDPSAFLNIMDQGLETLAQRPDMEPQSEKLLDGLTGPYAGEVGTAKSEILGGDISEAERSGEAAGATVEDRIRNLYTELTHYQIAWKIAQNVQRDISQVLRGS